MSNFETSEIYQKISTVEPMWNKLVRLKDIYPEQKKLLLHAGPSFQNFQEIPEAVRNSLAIAILFEGWAKNKEEALILLEQDQVKISPAQDFDAVVPLAGVISPSMYLLQIENVQNAQDKTYAVLNEGMQWCTRLGIFDEKVIEHLNWLHGEFSEWLTRIISYNPILLSPILQKSLKQGDDGHGRTYAGSGLIADTILDIADKNQIQTSQKIYDFLYGSVAFALNFWMAAALLILKTGQLSKDKQLIVKAGGNGIRFGYALSNQPKRWICVTAPDIKGNKEEIYSKQQALGTLGDSAVVDILGLGGQALDIAKISAENLIAFLPNDFATRMYAFTLMPIDFLGQRFGLVDLDKIQQNKKAPLILLGMISKNGLYGRIGGGVATLTEDMFNHLEISDV